MTLVKLRREQAGISQAELAERANMSPSKLSKIESGALKLKVDDVLILARALGCKSRELIPEIEEDASSPPRSP